MTPKTLTALAAIGIAGLLALPVPATANDKRADGIRNGEVMDFSSHRRYRRVVRHYYGPRYYYARPYYDPYYSYAYYPRYRYYRPGPHVHVGPGGFSFGW
jgi:hypothetical protein